MVWIQPGAPDEFAILALRHFKREMGVAAAWKCASAVTSAHSCSDTSEHDLYNLNRQ